MPVALVDSVGDAEERAVRIGSLEGVGRFLGSLSLGYRRHALTLPFLCDPPSGTATLREGLY